MQVCIYDRLCFLTDVKTLVSFDIVEFEGHTSGDLSLMWVKGHLQLSKAWPAAENCAICERAASIRAIKSFVSHRTISSEAGRYQA